MALRLAARSARTLTSVVAARPAAAASVQVTRSIHSSKASQGESQKPPLQALAYHSPQRRLPRSLSQPRQIRLLQNTLRPLHSCTITGHTFCSACRNTFSSSPSSGTSSRSTSPRRASYPSLPSYGTMHNASSRVARIYLELTIQSVRIALRWFIICSATRLVGVSVSRHMHQRRALFRVPSRFTEVQTGMSLPYSVSTRYYNIWCRYEREAWDLYGIFFKDHPDL